MITCARIDALREAQRHRTAPISGGSPRCARPRSPNSPPTTAPLQMSLFDQQDLAEITHPDYPGERLIACRNPALAAERARKRDELLAATEKLLDGHRRTGQPRHPDRGRQDRRGCRQGPREIQDGQALPHHHHRHQLHLHRNQAGIDAEAALDGIYVLRTSVDADALDPAAVVESYKNLANVERDFRSIKTDDLDLRPIHHRLADRVKAHVLICLLACYLIWHLRKAWAPSNIHRRTPTNTVTTPSPPPNAHPPPRPKPPTNTPRRQPAAQLHRPARPPGHPDPQPDPLPPHQHRDPCSPNPPPTNAAPSTSSTPRSRSPSPRSQNNHPTKTANPQVNPGIHPFQPP